MRQKSGRRGQTRGTRDPAKREEGRILNNTARGVKLGFLTRLATGMGQVPNDMSAHTENRGSTGSC